MPEERQILAVFIDFENLALGLKDRDEKFDIGRVLARLVEKGDIVVKRAYADWSRFSSNAMPLHGAAIELIEIPRRAMTGKNSADMRLCVDAMDLCYSKPHITTFVILSGDSDFSPLVSKLKENGKLVIGLGTKHSTSDLLRDNCHEYIYYEELKRDADRVAADLPGANPEEKEVFGLLLESLQALRRENHDTFWPSLIKDTMKRKQPSFSESAYGYRSFTKLLDDAAGRGLIEITRDSGKRSYLVTRFGPDLQTSENGETAEGGSTAKRRRRRRKPTSGEKSSSKTKAADSAAASD